MHRIYFALITAAGLWMSSPAEAQIALIRNLPTQPVAPEYQIPEIEINADVKEQVATVQLAQTFKNISSRTLETQFLFPLPADAAINGLTLIVDGKELTGQLQPKDEARKTYEAIVRRRKDPALLEYMGHGLFQTSVFPIPAGESRRVEIRYTQLLKADSGLVDFTLPLGTTRHIPHAVEKVSVSVRIKSDEELKNVYSPTHAFDIDRLGEKRAVCKLELKNVRNPDDIRLFYASRTSDVGMNLVTYQPEEGKQGYFLLLANPRIRAKKQTVIAKTVLFVVDRSGSMAGEKLEQAQASLRYMINQLRPEDTFNIISYSSEVDFFRPEPEAVTDETRKEALTYVDDIYSGGGTNINEALTSALKQLTNPKRPSYVMFLTDGLPTVGIADESSIAANVRKANSGNARVFSFGVGYDVNSRLLDRLTRDQRGTSVYVKPSEDIEVAATSLFQKVNSPAMTNVAIRFQPQDGTKPDRAVNRVYPAGLPDLFRGEQLVVVGRYRNPGDVTVRMTGLTGEKEQTMKLESSFGNATATRRNNFVETLWATRRIGSIIDDLDLNGQNDELVEELVDLSIRHGIMTPYTSFLADEETSFEDRSRLLTETRGRTSLGLSATSGQLGFAQREFKQSLQRAQQSRSFYGDSASGDVDRFSISPTAPARPSPIGRRYSASGGANISGRNAGGFGAAPVQLSEHVVNEGEAIAGNMAAQAKHERLKRVGSKVFYWKSSEWQDADLARLKKLPNDSEIISITQFSKEYFELTQVDNGRWTPYLTLKEPVLVQLKGRTYRIVPPKSESETAAEEAESADDSGGN